MGPAGSPPSAGAVDYVFYGSAPWDSAWLTEQNLAHALAGDHRVLYVEPAVSPLTPFRYGVSRSSGSELAKLSRRRLRAVDGLHVLTPLTLPPREHPRTLAVSRPYLRRQVGRAVRRLRLERPVVVAARSAVDLLGAAGERASVYLVKDLNEAGGAMLGKDPGRIARHVKAMCRQADLVVAVTRALSDTLSRRGVDAHVLPHGFHADLAPLYESAPSPAEYASLPAPRIGYAGRIDGRLDFEALGELADRFPHGSLVLVGPINARLPAGTLEPLAGRANVHLLGSRDRRALPGYLRHLDCCVMPYRSNEWLRHGSPLKLWDYLYAGPPLVGSGCTALRDYPLVEFAEDGDELPRLVARALQSGDGSRAERKAFALRNTWDHRAVELDRLVRDTVLPSTR